MDRKCYIIWKYNCNFTKINEIQQKETKTEKEQEILNKFELLKTKDIRNENRLNIFLDLCVPDEFRQVFIDRYI